jgi:hypothetical protein
LKRARQAGKPRQSQRIDCEQQIGQCVKKFCVQALEVISVVITKAKLPG